MLQLRTYHCVCDPLATYHERVPINNLARFYDIDVERMAVARECHLNSSIVQTLQEGLHSSNAWVPQYRSIMLGVLQNPDSQSPDACITFQSRKQTSRPRDLRRRIPRQQYLRSPSHVRLCPRAIHGLSLMKNGMQWLANVISTPASCKLWKRAFIHEMCGCNDIARSRWVQNPDSQRPDACITIESQEHEHRVLFTQHQQL